MSEVPKSEPEQPQPDPIEKDQQTADEADEFIARQVLEKDAVFFGG
jgi:hypothetical protein